MRGWAAGAHDHFMDDDDDATTARVVAAASAATQWTESETMTSARCASSRSLSPLSQSVRQQSPPPLAYGPGAGATAGTTANTALPRDQPAPTAIGGGGRGAGGYLGLGGTAKSKVSDALNAPGTNPNPPRRSGRQFEARAMTAWSSGV